MARGVAASPLELTHEVQALQNKLALLWPKKEKEVEAQFLQLSVNNFNEYVTKLKALLAKLREEAERRRRETKVYRSSDWANVNLVAHLLNQDYDAIHYVGWYAKEVHTIAWKWPNWRGNLMKWVWTVDCRLFTKHMQDRCASWNGDPDAWNEVKELLNG